MEEKHYKPIIIEDLIKIEKLYSLHYYTYSKSFKFEGENHDFFELIYCDAGVAKLTDGEDEYILPQGSAFLHLPNRFHTIMSHNAFTNVFIASFDGKLNLACALASKVIVLTKSEKTLIKNIIAEAKNAFEEPLNIVYQYELKPCKCLPFGSLQLIKNNIESLLIGMNRLNNNGYFPQSKAQNSCLTALAPKLSCSTSALSLKNEISLQTNFPTNNHSEAIAAKIIEILEHNISNNIRLQELAATLSYSETYIKKVFKSVTGDSIINCFIQMKIEKAKQLLSETAYSITQISELLGFDSVQYFSRLFKRITNLTPTAYSHSISSGIL